MTLRRDENTQVLENENETFLDLVRRLPPDCRRVLNLLLRKVADVEESEGETAALTLIDDVSTIIATPHTTH
ncbi:hypothetical protein [Caulobacter mirabilis]|uniref:Transcriptional regulator n=1 Tax=Caulobacter mirabilis TaxID=69666 RepID=A0A2D2B1L6_9CAUL|nr:hypothetical protein [Caulobacter mirabilis]ATQ44133.1 hypothetical protein CSW64_17935 [Caulobacter mirabilis]